MFLSRPLSAQTLCFLFVVLEVGCLSLRRWDPMGSAFCYPDFWHKSSLKAGDWSWKLVRNFLCHQVLSQKTLAIFYQKLRILQNEFGASGQNFQSWEEFDLTSDVLGECSSGCCWFGHLVLHNTLQRQKFELFSSQASSRVYLWLVAQASSQKIL